MLKLKLQYFGYLMGSADSLTKTMILGKIEGRRRRWWQRTRWSDGITDSKDMSLNKLQEMVRIRKPGMLQSMRSKRLKDDWGTEQEQIYITSLCLESDTEMILSWSFVRRGLKVPCGEGSWACTQSLARWGPTLFIPGFLWESLSLCLTQSSLSLKDPKAQIYMTFSSVDGWVNTCLPCPSYSPLVLCEKDLCLAWLSLPCSHSVSHLIHRTAWSPWSLLKLSCSAS